MSSAVTGIFATFRDINLAHISIDFSRLFTEFVTVISDTATASAFEGGRTNKIVFFSSANSIRMTGFCILLKFKFFI